MLSFLWMAHGLHQPRTTRRSFYTSARCITSEYQQEKLSLKLKIHTVHSVLLRYKHSTTECGLNNLGCTAVVKMFPAKEKPATEKKCYASAIYRFKFNLCLRR